MIIQPGKLLSSGKTSKVYAFGRNRVIKLFNSGSHAAEYEVSVINHVIACGGSTPESFGITQIGNRYGIILERIRGKNLLRALVGKPWEAEKTGRLMAQLHASIHLIHVPELRAQTPHLPEKIKRSNKLSEEKYEQIISYLNSLSFQIQLCHGDFQLRNIIVSPNGLVAVDWADAWAGNAFADVARTYLILQSPDVPFKIPGITWLLRKIKSSVCKAYLSEYMKVSKCSWQDIQNWLLPMAAAKLEEKIANEENWLLKFIDDELEKIQEN